MTGPEHPVWQQAYDDYHKLWSGTRHTEWDRGQEAHDWSVFLDEAKEMFRARKTDYDKAGQLLSMAIRRAKAAQANREDFRISYSAMLLQLNGMLPCVSTAGPEPDRKDVIDWSSKPRAPWLAVKEAAND